MTLNPRLNRRDTTGIKAILDTIFGAYDENCINLTGTPKIREVSIDKGAGAYDSPQMLVIRVEVSTNVNRSRVPVVFYYDYNNETASGYLEKVDEDCGSDDDPDWQMESSDLGLSLLCFIAAVKEELVK